MSASEATAPTVAAVIGDPVRHSLSPAIHNAAFVAADLDWTYTAFEIPAGYGGQALDAMRILGLGGMSVTMPHKDQVAAAADEVSDAVAVLGAANCVVPMGDGRLRAENTDGVGFVRGLEADAGVDPAGRRAVVIGAGGAARAVVQALDAAGAAEVVVVSRTRARAESAAAVAERGRVGEMSEVSGADLVVNATPLGMIEHPGLPCPVELLDRGQVAVDLVYSPARTDWLERLDDLGIEAHNGLSMLVHQAAAAFEMWTDVPAPIEVMRRAVLEREAA